MKRTNSNKKNLSQSLSIIMIVFLIAITTSTPVFASVQNFVPQADSNIILESEENTFLPYQPGNEAKEQYNPSNVSNMPQTRGIFSKKIKNVQTTTYNLYYALTEYTENNYVKEPTAWPRVHCSASAGTTIGTSINASVGVDAKVVKSGVGYTVSGSKTITAGEEYEYTIPYGQKGRIILRYSQKQSTFDIYNWLNKKIGNGSCTGLPYNSYVTLQRYHIW